MVTKLYQLPVHLVVPLTINHKTNHYIYFLQAFNFEIFENVRPLLQTDHTHNFNDWEMNQVRECDRRSTHHKKLSH